MIEAIRIHWRKIPQGEKTDTPTVHRMTANGADNFMLVQEFYNQVEGGTFFVPIDVIECELAKMPEINDMLDGINSDTKVVSKEDVAPLPESPKPKKKRARKAKK